MPLSFDPIAFRKLGADLINTDNSDRVLERKNPLDNELLVLSHLWR
jgi:hypothetical protein